MQKANEHFVSTRALRVLSIVLIFVAIDAVNLANPPSVANRLLSLELVVNVPNLLGQIFEPDDQSPKAVNISDWDGEKCIRPCEKDAEPRICYYNWVMENYHAMGPACGNCANGVIEDCYKPQCVTADGIERGVMSINRQIPGPTIQVCKNDFVVVDVDNRMGGSAATIHWHGTLQRQTPFMDGVPYITQCPIQFSTTFRYAFPASDSGTLFYHSHAGHHKVNGHYGAMIVREPLETDPNAHLFDYDLTEHYIFASDWMHEVAEMLVPGLPTRASILPDSILINGFGRYTDPVTDIRTPTPLHVYRVQEGGRYRFRFINSGSHVCPMQLKVDGHKLRVIAADGFNVQPRLVDTIVALAGERYDFVLDAVITPGEYFVQLRAIGLCTGLNIEQVAILTYSTEEAASNIDLLNNLGNLTSQEFVAGVTLNDPAATCYQQPDEATQICMADLESYDADESVITATPDQTILLGFNNYVVDNSILYSGNNYDQYMNLGGSLNMMGAINNMSMVLPSFPPLTQPDDITGTTFCDNQESAANCASDSLCKCTHRVQLKLNSVVEFIIVDETAAIGLLNHPIHIHGHPYHVMGMGRSPDGQPMTKAKARSMYRSSSLNLMPPGHKAPLKDTIAVPSKGYAVVRIFANNPGFWFLHCHFEWHMGVGMALVFQVGELEDMVKPPTDFPKCGNFLPSISNSVLD